MRQIQTWKKYRLVRLVIGLVTGVWQIGCSQQSLETMRSPKNGDAVATSERLGSGSGSGGGGSGSATSGSTGGASSGTTGTHGGVNTTGGSTENVECRSSIVNAQQPGISNEPIDHRPEAQFIKDPDGRNYRISVSANDEVIVARTRADGSVDRTYGVNGTFQKRIGSGLGIAAQGFLFDRQGRLLIAGNRNRRHPQASDITSDAVFFLLRINQNGTIDSSFNPAGKSSVRLTAITGEPGYHVFIPVDFLEFAIVPRWSGIGGMYLDRQGDIVLAISRTTGFYRSDSAHVVLFKQSGDAFHATTVGTRATAMLMDQSCRPVVMTAQLHTDDEHNLIKRLYRDGDTMKIDPTFSVRSGLEFASKWGPYYAPITTMVGSDDGSFYVGKQNSISRICRVFQLLHFNADGTLDRSFGVDGVVDLLPELGTPPGMCWMQLHNAENGSILIEALDPFNVYRSWRFSKDHARIP